MDYLKYRNKMRLLMVQQGTIRARGKTFRGN